MPETAVHTASGKVRELYALDEETLLLVASDRISVFDVVLPTEIPEKGCVLTGLSAFWFGRTRSVIDNHLVEVRADARTSVCRRLEMLPIECVVRGYLAGSGWKDYRRTGSVCGHRLPPGLVEAARLPEPIFTPSTKATKGHDENIDSQRAAELVGRSRLAELEEASLALYRFAADWALERGIILADTKLEFGLAADGSLVLADEAFTPDSSRFWPAAEHRPGGPQASFDKQFARDHCEGLGWDKREPGPELPDAVVTGTRRRYVDAFERLTERSFDAYLADPAGIVAAEPTTGVRATVLVRPRPGMLDPQGEAVRDGLMKLGFPVSRARLGRVVELELVGSDATDARAALQRMCEQLLANPLIETYEIQLDSPPAAHAR